MQDIVSDYYHQLMYKESFSADNLYKRQVVLANVQQKVTNVMASHLLQPFTSHEIFSTAKSLGKDVCLEGVGFNLHYWEFLGSLLERLI